MEEKELEEIYKIDEKRLITYYKRIENQSSDLPINDVIAKFLQNQSIGKSFGQILMILNYYEEKISQNKSILDFALEWIRAQKIRFEYRKHLNKAQYPNFKVALDDCIFLFFSKFDNHIRNLLKDDIKEYEISALYEVFFSPDDKNVNIIRILQSHKENVPTIYRETVRMNTRLITLRAGLANIIKSDWNA
ncbi:MAG: hypothetical protein EU542_05940 [Promethearchaeota archaeon]|nr:MAG: hypothetical protein EU542_05940 [Candidatus Lokiarchaeota archaeon]